MTRHPYVYGLEFFFPQSLHNHVQHLDMIVPDGFSQVPRLPINYNKATELPVVIMAYRSPRAAYHLWQNHPAPDVNSHRLVSLNITETSKGRSSGVLILGSSQGSRLLLIVVTSGTLCCRLIFSHFIGH
jgi:hypothetical protein